MSESAGTLYVVATPIGNTEDITARARRILAEADIVAAEDTRTTQKLFTILGIQNRTISNHRFNEKSQVDFLVSELENGKNVAIVSDAGTPCISDPGGIIVKAAAERGIKITGVCGPSSVITALSVCGFCFDSFAFYGFLPKSAREIKKIIDTITHSDIKTFVLFESPKRVKKFFEILAVELPEARVCLCNDISKMFERIYRGMPKNILNELNENPSAEKGEYTIVINTELSHNALEMTNDSQPAEELTAEALIIDYMVKNNGTVKDAVNALHVIYGEKIPKKEFYNASIRLRSILRDAGHD